MKPRILLADHHEAMRGALRAFIEREEDLEVVGEAATGRQTVELAAQLSPDVVVLDIGMPELSGVEAARRVVAASPRAKLIVLSTYGDKPGVLAMLEAGAWGYVVKSRAGEVLRQAILSVLSDRKYLCPEVAGLVVDGYTSRLFPVETPARAVLTPRERQVLGLLAEGRTSRSIADAMNISQSTVDVHRRHIMNKLGLRSIAKLTKYAVREGLTPA